MSLATIEKEIRASVENAATWLKETAEEHLPAFQAELERIAASPVTQAIEAAVLTPAEESWVAGIIAGLPALRAQPPGAAEAAPGDVQSAA